MRLRVRFHYNETTGEVETFQVDAITTGERAADHDHVHDRISAELAGVVEHDAEIVEQRPAARPHDATQTPPVATPTTETPRRQQTLPPEALGG